MNSILTQLQEMLMEHSLNQESSSLNCMSVYRCYRPQQLYSIPFNQPTLLMVAKGNKGVQVNTSEMMISKGDLLLVPPGSTLWLGQFPNKNTEPYLGLGLRFDMKALKHFRQIYGALLDTWDISSKWQYQASDSILTALKQFVELGQNNAVDPQIIQHRQVELLLLLAQEGLVGNLLLGEHPSWKIRVSNLLSIDPAYAWQLDEVCIKLSTSESSLRRNLKNENSGFRELLEEVRLTTGLSLLLETQKTIGQISDASGYLSQSRFGERFKKRFGMTPSELRHTLIQP